MGNNDRLAFVGRVATCTHHELTVTLEDGSTARMEGDLDRRLPVYWWERGHRDPRDWPAPGNWIRGEYVLENGARVIVEVDYYGERTPTEHDARRAAAAAEHARRQEALRNAPVKPSPWPNEAGLKKAMWDELLVDLETCLPGFVTDGGDLDREVAEFIAPYGYEDERFQKFMDLFERRWSHYKSPPCAFKEFLKKALVRK